MSFENDKKVFLDKLDKSKKGSIDKGIKKIVDLINSKPSLYTTSSCSGRITLLDCPESYKKDDCEWIYSTHDDAVLEDMKEALKKSKKDEVWLMEEPPILHVCCKTISDAQKVVNAAKEAGFKRTGIISTEKKIIVEIISTEKVNAPVAIEGEMIVDDAYLKILIEKSNKKLEMTRKKMEKFSSITKTCRSSLSTD
jgi:tRNA wybutosine-synthesizing protein 3